MKISLGTWSADKKQKEMGAFLLLTTENAFEAFGMALLTRTLGMETQDTEELIRGAKKESRSRKIHSYFTQYVFVTSSQMLRLICGKIGTCTARRNPSKRVISNDHSDKKDWKFQDFGITGELLQDIPTYACWMR